MNRKYIAGAAVGAVLCIGVGFAGGLAVSGKTKATALRDRGGTAQFAAAARSGQRGGPNGGFAGGEVVSVDATSMTIKTMNGGTRLVVIGSAGVKKTTNGSLTDIVSGAQVNVTGTANSDGSITADSIIIR